MTKKPKDPTEGHTPGPWKVAVNTDGRWMVFSDKGMIGAIADLRENEPGREEADARLIAQAPALLAENKRLREAAKGALESMDEFLIDGQSLGNAANRLRAVLAQSESKEAKP